MHIFQKILPLCGNRLIVNILEATNAIPLPLIKMEPVHISVDIAIAPAKRMGKGGTGAFRSTPPVAYYANLSVAARAAPGAAGQRRKPKRIEPMMCVI